MQRTISLFAGALWLVSCLPQGGASKRDKKVASEVSPTPQGEVVQEQRGMAYSISLSHGEEPTTEIPLTLKLAGEHQVLSFPSNGLLSGAEIRLCGRRVSLVDTTTQRYAPIPRAHQEGFLGVSPGKHHLFELRTVGREGELQYLEFEVLSSRKRLLFKVIQDPHGPKASRALLRFLFLPLTRVKGATLPEAVRAVERPVAWSVTTYAQGERGQVQFKLLSRKPTVFVPTSLVCTVERFKRVKVATLLSGYMRNHVVSHNAVHLTSTRSGGVVYLNGQPMDFLGRNSQLYLPLSRGGVVYVAPLLGGVSPLTRYLTAPMEWVLK